MYSADKRKDPTRSSRKIIGVMINELATEFSQTLIRGITNAIPEDKDIHVVILAGKYDNNENMKDKNHRYNRICNSIYKFGEQCRFDGMIFSLDGVGYSDSWMRHDDYFKRFGDVPKVLIASNLENYVTVNYDNEYGIREAINCLVNVNRFTKICMLGGRDNHLDSNMRKAIFVQCLKENGLEFSDRIYERTDLTVESEQAAERLLDRNPDVEAIFCANDAVAVGLYKAMKNRGLVPGEDIMVIGFDNTHMAEEMLPPLTSIGSDTVNPGHKALELLLAMLNGEKVSSAVVKTRLYGRESYRYDMYEYNSLEMLNVEAAFIYRMFDDCFYRYSNEKRSRKDVDLRRLFFEFISRMLYSMKRRFMSIEEYEQIERMVDIFFQNGAMEYTDAAKLLKCIQRLQNGMNETYGSANAIELVNELFLHIRDVAILSMSYRRTMENNNIIGKQQEHRNYMIYSMIYDDDEAKGLKDIIWNFDKIGAENAALCMFEKTIIYNSRENFKIPERINLCCVVKGGELHILPEERQSKDIREFFTKEDLFSRSKAFAAFPIFYGNRIYGLFISELSKYIFSTGESIANKIGMTIYIAKSKNGTE